MPLRLTKASTQIRSCPSERFGCYLVGLSVPHLKELGAYYALLPACATPNIEKSAQGTDFYAEQVCCYRAATRFAMRLASESHETAVASKPVPWSGWAATARS